MKVKITEGILCVFRYLRNLGWFKKEKKKKNSFFIEIRISPTKLRTKALESFLILALPFPS